ncbi:MAG: JAB domain-containing protein [Betaproteobacteria bacterium]|nr:JAB domain-containing protein [Betaproteobacteria bacterium]
MSIKSLPPELRPREKLLRLGPRSLADAELLAVLLRTGHGGQDALGLSHALLQRSGGLGALLRDVPRSPGLGPARRAELGAVVELARRSLVQSLADRSVFDSPERVREYLQLEIAHREQEVFMVLFVDAQHQLLAAEELFRGTLSQTSVYPREVVKRALAHNAAAVVLAHNHPSGCAEPSRADTHLTQVLRSALALVDVQVLDHFVVTSSAVTSMAERGLA